MPEIPIARLICAFGAGLFIGLIFNRSTKQYVVEVVKQDGTAAQEKDSGVNTEVEAHPLRILRTAT